MFTPELLLQVEPAPVTVTVPTPPAPLPRLAVKLVILMTCPPFAITSMPVPKLPTLSPPLGPLTQREPGSITVTVPVEPTDNPTEPPPPLTVPPLWMVSVPVPTPPTTMLPAFDQLEPAPVTVTEPSPPVRLPTVPNESAKVPPFWIASIPVPFGPTDRFLANAPGLLITVEFGVTVLMLASSVCLGKLESQLPLKNHSDETRPVQLRVWAYVDTVDVAKSAIVASPLNKTNLQRDARFVCEAHFERTSACPAQVKIRAGLNKTVIATLHRQPSTEVACHLPRPLPCYLGRVPLVTRTSEAHRL